jgi:hypothetical protein
MTNMTANPLQTTASIWDRTSPELRRRYESKLRPITDRLGQMLLQANDPEAITDEVLQIVDIARLKPRYAVGKELRMVPLLQKLMPEIAFERMIAKQFKI